MANTVFNSGKTRVGTNASIVGGTTIGTPQTVSRYIQTMSVDDGTASFVNTDTTLSTSGAPTNEFDQLLDGFATIASQVATHVMTIAGTSAFDGFTIKRIVLHDDTVANVTKTSTTIVAGVDAQSILKVAGVQVALTLTITYA